MDQLMKMMAEKGITPEAMRRSMNDPAAMQRMFAQMQVSSNSNTSNEGSGDHYIKMMEEAKKNFERERSLPPGPAPKLDRGRFLQQLSATRNFSPGIHGENLIRTTYIGLEKHTSTTPLNELARVRISEMQVRNVHRGQYLLCRIISLPVRIVAVQFAVEDPEGSCQQLSIYNFPGTFGASNEQLDSLFSMGMTLAIREPTLKMMAIGNQAHIRIDSPSDVVILQPGDPQLDNIKWRLGPQVPGTRRPLTTASACKEQGDGFFKRGWYLHAASAYSRGFELDPNAHLLRLNRSMAYLRLQYWNAALSDCDALLRLKDLPKDQKVKALYRAGQAEYGLQKWEAAKKRYEECLEEDPSQKPCEDGIFQISQRIAETSSGRYDWPDLFKKASKPAARLDIADYVGPIEVCNMPNRGGGRGVRALRDIRAGELLAVAKPFACSFPEELPPKETIISLDLITNSMGKRCYVALLSKVCERLASDPSLHKPIHQLYAGDSHPPPPRLFSSSPEVGLQPISRPFDCPLDLDVARIEGVLSYNVFSPSSVAGVDLARGSPAEDTFSETDTAAALYLLPSLFNHACDANAQWAAYGDTLVIRASQDITAGEEVQVRYYYDEGTTYENQKTLSKWFTACDCALCKADRQDGKAACEKRRKISENLKLETKEGETNPRQFHNIQRLKTALQNLQATYTPDRKATRPALFRAHTRLAMALCYHGDTSEGFQQYFKALESYGLRVLDKSTQDGRSAGSKGKMDRLSLPISTKGIPQHTEATQSIEICAMIARQFNDCGDEVRAERWMRAIWWIEGVMTGGSVEILKARNKAVLQMAGIMELCDKVILTPSHT